MRRLSPRSSLALLLTLAATGSHASLSLPDTPLQAGSLPPSNIMLLLDDSGSMQFEIMPDDNIPGSAYYLFPRPNNAYGSSVYTNAVLTFDATNTNGVLRRSATGNSTFYDPAIDYAPWKKADGSSYPDATTTAAYYNPSLTSAGSLDLTQQATQSANWADTNGNTSSSSKSFYPITFYVYKGSGSTTDRTSYLRYQYRNGTLFRASINSSGTTGETSVASLTWGSKTRTAAQEVQNFANWFSYYRSRILAARAALTTAFNELSPNDFRVGFRTINNAGTAMDIPLTGTFSGTNRTNWFNNVLTTPIGANGTPSRTALIGVGEYFRDSSNTGPWGPAPQLACRRSFTILTSDGYWNDSNVSIGNVDNSNGPTVTGPNSQSYAYSPARPYSDSYSNTLADIAMYYWNRDLNTSLGNSVAPTPGDPAFWQHMTTFTLSIGVQGTLNPDTDLPALTSGAKNWPDPTSSNAAKIDDMWHAAVNSRGAFVAAQNPSEFTDGLKAALASIASSGAVSKVDINSSTLTTSSKVFSARFDSSWGGEIEAYSFNSTTGALSTTPVWKASTALPAFGSRTIYTKNDSGSGGVAFTWASLSTAQKTALGNVSTVLDYLRGDRSRETATTAPIYRRRTSPIGDPVHSAPYYLASNDTVFIGTNDGMLHAFNASTGVEQFAYVPSPVFSKLKLLSDPAYTHKYFVDGEVAVSPANAATGNRNILVGTLGLGGDGLYALDVTAPGSFNAGKVLWEFTDPDLGLTAGPPVIARLNNGVWAAIVGNGPNSASERAMLFVVNLQTGALIRKIDTQAGSSTSSNGLSVPTGWDADGDGIPDLFYAGDLLGNVWKFDLSGTDPSKWDSAFKSGTVPQPLFQARNGSNQIQPITGGIAIGLHPRTNQRWLFFGTGRYMTSDDSSNLQVQSWYGLIDAGQTIGARAGTLTQRSVAGLTTDAQGRTVRTFSLATANDVVGKSGWYLDLLNPGSTGAGERILSRSQFLGSVLLASSFVPSTDPCAGGGNSYINAINPFTGTSLATPYFDQNNDGLYNDSDKVTINKVLSTVGSIQISGALTGEVSFIGGKILLGGNSGNIATPTALSGRLAYQTGRIAWYEIVGD